MIKIFATEMVGRVVHKVDEGALSAGGANCFRNRGRLFQIGIDALEAAFLFCQLGKARDGFGSVAHCEPDRGAESRGCQGGDGANLACRAEDDDGVHERGDLVTNRAACTMKVLAWCCAFEVVTPGVGTY